MRPDKSGSHSPGFHPEVSGWWRLSNDGALIGQALYQRGMPSLWAPQHRFLHSHFLLIGAVLAKQRQPDLRRVHDLLSDSVESVDVCPGTSRVLDEPGERHMKTGA